ncbi:MAG: hypothetical protein ABL940_11305, partial [Bacteroidia bacterium]
TLAINTVTNTSTANNLTTTVNGVAGVAVPIVNSLSNTYNTTTGAFNTTVNGIVGANVTLPTPQSIKDSITNNSWLLKGNTGTTAGTNFIGTTDAKDLVFKTNSIENMRILNTNGNVGIGTITPTAKLYLQDNIPVGSLDLVMDNTAPSGQQWVFESIATFGTFTPGSFAIGNRTTSASPLVITPANNVGIGTTAPATKLHVLDGKITQEFTTNTSHSILMKNPSGRNWQLYHLSPTDVSAPNGFMFEHFDGTAWQRRVTINQTGHVGIGTATPNLLRSSIPVGGSVLNLSSTLDRAFLNVEGVYADISLIDIDATLNNKWMILRTAGGLTSFITHNDIGTGKAVILNIDHTTSNVGIGTTAPTEPLHVIGNLLGASRNQNLAGDAQRIATGSTAPGAGWVQYTATPGLPSYRGIYIDVNTASAGFTSIPFYFSSMVGNTNHWTVTGVTSIYSPTATGFRIYLQSTTEDITPAIANTYGWYINWMGVGK